MARARLVFRRFNVKVSMGSSLTLAMSLARLGLNLKSSVALKEELQSVSADLASLLCRVKQAAKSIKCFGSESEL